MWPPGFSATGRGLGPAVRTVVPGRHLPPHPTGRRGDQVAGRFTCSGTHRGAWLGHPPTGRRFQDVDEVYFFRFQDGLIAEAWGLEDNASRLRQLDLT